MRMLISSDKVFTRQLTSVVISILSLSMDGRKKSPLSQFCFPYNISIRLYWIPKFLCLFYIITPNNWGQTYVLGIWYNMTKIWGKQNCDGGVSFSTAISKVNIIIQVWQHFAKLLYCVHFPRPVGSIRAVHHWAECVLFLRVKRPLPWAVSSSHTRHKAQGRPSNIFTKWKPNLELSKPGNNSYLASQAAAHPGQLSPDAAAAVWRKTCVSPPIINKADISNKNLATINKKSIKVWLRMPRVTAGCWTIPSGEQMCEGCEGPCHPPVRPAAEVCHACVHRN